MYPPMYGILTQNTEEERNSKEKERNMRIIGSERINGIDYVFVVEKDMMFTKIKTFVVV